ncbi:MAG: response regulator transcription factor [Streptosporangiaceae bacterium]|nr:response regulator transcription factor [Streptosporangiaceae bacterium]
MLDERVSQAPDATLPGNGGLDEGASLPDGLDRARIPVHVWARDPISLAGLTSALVCRPELKIVDADRGAQARVALIAADTLDESVLAMLRSMRAQGRARTVLVISELTDDDVLAVVDAGVSALVWRWEATATWLSQVVVKAAAGQPALPDDVLSRLLRQIGRLNRQVLSPRGLTLNGLSAREIDVLRLAAEGLDTEEIAHRLAYSARTVTNVLHDITCRFQLRNRTHAVAYAIREGLI